MSFSPDGQTLASGGRDDTIHLWDVDTGTLKHTLTGHSDDVYNVAFSPDGETLASGSEDDTIRLWDVGTGTLKHTFTGHQDDVGGVFPPTNVFSVSFSPDGETLASGGRDTIFVWILRHSYRLPNNSQ